ncbi:sialin-like isoform X2 [Anthonomus grandis grandis]|uniref:sialin-like isoform X2 n=1 Tax=Anthonomus grandis grandis TaxID=2921223 RepID=UPI0021652C4B|nr:sialin-like isoform X2 [Anthonomus grandis grandis]
MVSGSQNLDNIKKPDTWKLWTQKRYVLTFLVFLGYFNIYCLRTNMSIGIVAMTQDRVITLSNGTNLIVVAEFDWDNVLQGYVLSSFFYGYMVTQLLGGILGRKFGGKLIFGGGIASTAFITVISPWLAEWSVYALIVSRILMGLFEGVTFSSLFTLWIKWLPPNERARCMAQVNSGSYTGAIFAMMVLAYLADAAGWRSIFWLSGGLGLVWFVAWLYLVSESPDTDPTITPEELNYIKSNRKESTKRQNFRDIRWTNIITSKAAWSLHVLFFCESWGFYTLLTQLPKYFKDIFAFDISKSGVLSAIPYVALALMMQLSGVLLDKITRWLSTTNARKLFVLIGFLAQTGFMLGAAFGNAVALTVFCLTMAVGLGSMSIAVMTVNSLDIAPLHSGILFGIANTIGTSTGIISPIAAGYIISTENPVKRQLSSGELYFICRRVFTYLGR